MRTAKELTYYFTVQKNKILFEETGMWLLSEDDLYDLKTNFSKKEYENFLFRMAEKRLHRVNPEEKTNCHLCFSKGFCDLSDACYLENSVICDFDICPWCISDSRFQYKKCGECSYGNRNGYCTDNMYEKIRTIIDEKYPESLGFLTNNGYITSLPNGYFTSLPKIKELIQRVTYDFLTGEELIDNE